MDLLYKKDLNFYLYLNISTFTKPYPNERTSDPKAWWAQAK